jgi:hypothetical protein
MGGEEIKSTLGFNSVSNKIFMGVYEKNIQHYPDTKSSTVTVSIYEDAKAGRKLIDTVRVRLEYEFLNKTLGLTVDELKNDREVSNAKIIEATIRIVKSTFKHARGTFPKKEIVWTEHHNLKQQD